MDEGVYPKDFFIDLIFTDARSEQSLKLGKKKIKVKTQKAFEETYITVPEIDGDRRVLYSKDMDEKGGNGEKGDKKKEGVNVEEQIIFQGSKNKENKDDFWISLNDQIQKRKDLNEEDEGSINDHT